MIVGHIGGADSPYEIQKSLRLRSSNNAYLNRTPSVAGSKTQMTFSFWVKPSLASNKCLFGTALSGTQIEAIGFDLGYGYGAERLHVVSTQGTLNVSVMPSRRFRDPSAWYHIVVVIDTPNATAADRIRIYVNGVRETVFDIASYPSQNYQFQYWNNTNQNTIGQLGPYYGSYQFDGYLAEIRVIDGQSLDASYFGAFSAETGTWIPKKYTGSYGTNGFYLPFNDGSNLTNLTADRSGNGNNWTANNISLTSGVTYDWMDDTPTNNYPVLNPIANSGYSPVDGNLRVETNIGYQSCPATMLLPLSGKYYFEYVCINYDGSNRRDEIGIIDNSVARTIVGMMANSAAYLSLNGAGVIGGTQVATYTGWAGGNIVMCAFDASTGKVWFGLDGVWNGNPSAGTGQCGTLTNNGNLLFCLSNAGDGQPYYTTRGHMNFGQRPFAYAPPTGFKALCTKNLPTPSILNPKKYFDVVLATGANIKSTVEALYSDQALMVVKDRANANNWQWFNDVTGLSAILQSNTISAETTYSAPTGSSVGYGWKAGGAPVTNNAGSIQSQVSANPQAGFSIVTYTGTGANATVGHGLGVAPKMVIVKRRNSTGDWLVWNLYVALTGSDRVLFLNTTDSQTPAGTNFNSSSPTSSVVNLGTNAATNASGGTHVAYCFAEIPGYSKIGSYTGNGSADGPFVYCGFRPRFVMVKRVDAAGSWLIADSQRTPANSQNLTLQPESANAEFTSGAGTIWDNLSNGFKIRSSSAQNPGLNTNGGTYIFYAIAEQPFQFANAR